MANAVEFDEGTKRARVVRLVADGGRLRSVPMWRVEKTSTRVLRDYENGIRQEAARRLRLVFSQYTDEERETWPQQVEEAQALALNPLAPAPMIRAMAEQRTETAAELAAIILANAEAFKLAAGEILGAQSALLQMSPIPADYTNDSYWP